MARVLNKRGNEIAHEWNEIWKITADEDYAEKGANYEGGWDVLFQRNKVHNADDFIGVLLAAYGDDAIDYVEEVCYGNGFKLDDEYEFGVSFGEYINRLNQYFEEDEDREEALDVLNRLRDAQRDILSAVFSVDDRSKLEQAMTLIGDVMDGISELYELPIMSQQ